MKLIDKDGGYAVRAHINDQGVLEIDGLHKMSIQFAMTFFDLAAIGVEERKRLKELGIVWKAKAKTGQKR